ncbi:MAG TPA: hypothetical protein VMH26_00220 [Burkholderiales bacterium]|nr:hypothetical protein [Burkholderiales bacterium]
MEKKYPELDQMQNAYKAAVEEWIAAIRKEEALASTNHTVAQVDRWEQAHFQEEEARNRVKAAKKAYEAALRAKFFGFK